MSGYESAAAEPHPLLAQLSALHQFRIRVDVALVVVVLTLTNLIAEDPQVPAIRDDQPINEYFLLRSWFHFIR